MGTLLQARSPVAAADRATSRVSRRASSSCPADVRRMHRHGHAMTLAPNRFAVLARAHVNRSCPLFWRDRVAKKLPKMQKPQKDALRFRTFKRLALQVAASRMSSVSRDTCHLESFNDTITTAVFVLWKSSCGEGLRRMFVDLRSAGASELCSAGSCAIICTWHCHWQLALATLSCAASLLCNSGTRSEDTSLLEQT